MDKVKIFLESKRMQHVITAVIIINAIALGVLSDKSLNDIEIKLLEGIDGICLLFFIIELILKLLIYRKSFFYEAWNIFDFIIIIGSVGMISSSFSVLRAFRIFRILKVISEFSELRILVSAMLKTIPTMSWALVLLFIIFYIFAVFGNTLYGQLFPESFGNLGVTMFTLFQVMTLEGWASEIAKPIMQEFDFAWIYFVSFILLTSIIVLNVMVGIVVEAVSQISNHEKTKKKTEATDLTEIELINIEFVEVKEHLQHLEELIRIHNKGKA